MEAFTRKLVGGLVLIMAVPPAALAAPAQVGWCAEPEVEIVTPTSGQVVVTTMPVTHRLHLCGVALFWGELVSDDGKSLDSYGPKPLPCAGPGTGGAFPAWVVDKVLNYTAPASGHAAITIVAQTCLPSWDGHKVSFTVVRR